MSLGDSEPAPAGGAWQMMALPAVSACMRFVVSAFDRPGRPRKAFVVEWQFYSPCGYRCEAWGLVVVGCFAHHRPTALHRPTQAPRASILMLLQDHWPRFLTK